MRHRIRRSKNIYQLAAAVIAGFLPALVIIYAVGPDDIYLVVYALFLWGICAFLMYSLLNGVGGASDRDFEYVVTMDRYEGWAISIISILLIISAVALNHGLGNSAGYFQEGGIPFLASLFLISLGLFILSISIPTISRKRINSTDIAASYLVAASLTIIVASMIALFYLGKVKAIYLSLVEVAFAIASAGTLYYVIYLMGTKSVQNEDQ